MVSPDLISVFITADLIRFSYLSTDFFVKLEICQLDIMSCYPSPVDMFGWFLYLSPIQCGSGTVPVSSDTGCSPVGMKVYIYF